MKNKLFLLVLVFCSMSLLTFAQKDKDEIMEHRAERRAANGIKVDYSVFRRQILALPEYAAQRKRLTELRKNKQGVPKIFAVVDSTEDEDSKTLTGYILITQGDNSANIYEITFDRTAKKIVSVKRTEENIDEEREEEADEDAPARKDTNKPAKKKKSSDDDDDED